MNIYVGNLAYSLSEENLKSEFENHGEVTSAKIITDHETGRSKGFAFVEMPNDEEAKTAIAELEGTELEGRALKVNQARPKPQSNRGEGSASRY